MTDPTVANAILQQLGGRQFTTMTGAKHLTAHPNALSFRIPCRTKDKSNYVKVTLNGRDTYDVEFLSIRGTNSRVCTYLEDIYNDSLRDCFERVTGLATRMPRVHFA